jgi:hypothetical protein
MLGIYLVALLSIFIAFIVGVAWAFQGDLEARMRIPLRATLIKYKVDWPALVKYMVDRHAQVKYKVYYPIHVPGQVKR